MQVPLFILIQSFHCYKRDKITFNLKKVLSRVIIPFLALEILTFVIALCIGKSDFKPLLDTCLVNGGFGPGSYYPWIYIQIALLLPLFGHILKKADKYVSLVIFLLVCDGFEIVLSLLGIPDHLYRLLAIRYIFLIYLGWLWVNEGVTINWITLLLSVLSLATIIYFEYYSVNDEPLFLNTAWKTHRWPCYFFVAFGLIALLHYIWSEIGKNRYVSSFVKRIAASSYEIFLIQMSLIFLVKSNDLQFIHNSKIQHITWVLFIWILSIAGGVLFHKVMNRPPHRTR